jgi:MFS family permease
VSDRGFRARLSPVVLIYGLILAMSMQFTAMVPLAPTFADRFALSKVETGTLFTVMGLAIVVVAMPIGLVADRLGARTVTIAAAGLLTASAIGQGAAENYPSLLLARAAFGVGFAAILSAAPAWLADSVEPERRPAALGAVMPIAGIGGLISPAGAGFLADHVGLAMPFYVLAGLTFCVFAALALAGAGANLRHPHQPLAATLRALTRERFVLGGVVAMALAGFTESAVNLLAPLQLRANGSSAGSIGVVFSISAAAFIVIGVFVARAAHRTARLSVGGAAAAGIGVAIVPFVASTATAAVVGSVVSRTAVSSVLYTIAFPLGALGAQRAGLGRGAVNGLLTLASGVANAAGPLSAGAVAEAAGGRWATGLLVAVSLTAAAWLLVPRRVTIARAAAGGPLG